MAKYLLMILFSFGFYNPSFATEVKEDTVDSVVIEKENNTDGIVDEPADNDAENTVSEAEEDSFDGFLDNYLNGSVYYGDSDKKTLKQSIENKTKVDAGIKSMNLLSEKERQEVEKSIKDSIDIMNSLENNDAYYFPNKE